MTQRVTRRVLVIDDELDIIQAVREVLEDEGYEVVTCSDALEGADLARTLQPDVLLLDIMMPKLNGLDLVRSLRSASRSRMPPVILMSALPQSSLKGEKLCEAYLHKPFGLEQLSRAVRRVIASSGPDRGPGAPGATGPTGPAGGGPAPLLRPGDRERSGDSEAR